MQDQKGGKKKKTRNCFGRGGGQKKSVNKETS